MAEEREICKSLKEVERYLESLVRRKEVAEEVALDAIYVLRDVYAMKCRSSGSSSSSKGQIDKELLKRGFVR